MARERVDAVLPYVSPPVAAMIRLQWLTGMRSCEVVVMRPCDINTIGEVWFYEPFDHKSVAGPSAQVPWGLKPSRSLSRF